MDKEAFFADSCIFMGYAMEFETFHINCKVFFEKTEGDKYISKSVDDELKRKIKRRDDLYRDYVKYLGRNKKEEYRETPPEYEIDREKIKVRIRRNKGGKIYGKDIEIKRKGRNRILGK